MRSRILRPPNISSPNTAKLGRQYVKFSLFRNFQCQGHVAQTTNRERTRSRAALLYLYLHVNASILDRRKNQTSFQTISVGVKIISPPPPTNRARPIRTPLLVQIFLIKGVCQMQGMKNDGYPALIQLNSYIVRDARLALN